MLLISTVLILLLTSDSSELRCLLRGALLILLVLNRSLVLDVRPFEIECTGETLEITRL
jgi:hypothetical protein